MNSHGFTVALEHQASIRNDTLSLALRAKPQNAAESAIHRALFLLSDRHFDWKAPFIAFGQMVWLVDFDERMRKPWICVDSQSRLFRLSTNEVRKYALHDHEEIISVPAESAEVRAKSFAVWG